MSDVDNHFRMPDSACHLGRLPAQDHRDAEYSDRGNYLSLCQYYDRFKLTFQDYQSANWVPSKTEFKINFGVHYPCFKQDRATYETLLRFRTIYPNVPIVLVSDNGHDFSEMAKFFNCHYIHSTEQSGNGVTNVLKGNGKIGIWLQRLKNTCEILKDCDYILYMEDDLDTRSAITKNPNADLAGPSNPEDFWWSPQLVKWFKENRPGVEINGLNGCGGSIFKRSVFLECMANQPDYQEIGKLDDRVTWASDVILTFLFLYNKKVSRRWLDHSEEARGKVFGSTAFDHQHKYYYGRKWSPYYLKNTHLDKNQDFIFTACSDNIVKDQLVPFIASLMERTSYRQTVVIIDYGLSEANLKAIIDSGFRVIPSIGKHEIISDRFLSIDRYIRFLGGVGKVFAHFDCDIWFNKDISGIFDKARAGKALCTKDVWHCGFLHDCVAKEEHKEFNREILFEVERRCGKVLQAGFICGSTEFWKLFNSYLTKLLNNGYLKNVFGADELVLNLLYYYHQDLFEIMPIGFNTLPQWGVKDIGGKLVATDFHTDSKLSEIKDYTEEVYAIHLSSAARGKAEFAHTDFKVRHAAMYQKHLMSFSGSLSKREIILSLGFRHTMPKMLDALGCKVICEVGVQHGGNLFHMVDNSKVTEAWGVDIWKNTDNKAENDIGLSQKDLDTIYANVSARAAANGRVRIIRDFSQEACKKFSDGYFDFVYIDADHSYEGCLRDLECWWPKVKSGGIFAGDDYVDAVAPTGVRFGVIKAINEFVTKHGLIFSHTNGKDNRGSSPQWFISKP